MSFTRMQKSLNVKYRILIKNKNILCLYVFLGPPYSSNFHGLYLSDNLSFPVIFYQYDCVISYSVIFVEWFYCYHGLLENGTK